MKALDDLVDVELRRLDALALYAAEVVLQHADLTVDLRVSTERVAGLSRVRLRHGLPGVRVKLKRGARVLLGFEDGDVRRPFAALYSDSEVEELELTASVKVSVVAPEVNLGDENGLPVARQGDVVETTFQPGPMQVTGTLDGLPFTGVLVLGDTFYGVISAPDIRTKAS